MLVLAISAGAFAAHCLVQFVPEWLENKDAEHVWLAFPIGLYALTNRIHSSNPGLTPAWGIGLAFLLPASLCIYGNALFEEPVLLAVGALAGLAGSIALVFGTAALRRSAFPLALLAFCIPLPTLFTGAFLHSNLQRLGAGASGGLLMALGYEAEVIGNVILLDGKALNVAEACSGLRFMTGLAFGACMLGWMLIESQVIGRLILVGASLLIALAVNAIRLTIAGMIASTYDLATMQWFLHESYWVLAPYLLGAGMLYGVTHLLDEAGSEPLAVFAEDPA